MTLAEVTAAPLPVMIGGETYFLSVLRGVDWGEAARALNARRRRPLDIVKEALPGLALEEKQLLLDLAYRDERAGEFLPLEDVQRWFATPEGRAYRFWLSVRRKHPAVTLEAAEDLMLQMIAEDYQRADALGRESEGVPAANPPAPPPVAPLDTRNRIPGGAASPGD